MSKGIYTIKNFINGDCYIGSSIDLKRGTSILNCCKGKYPVSGGYKWEYYVKG